MSRTANQFLAIVALLETASILDRVPILPDLLPAFVAGGQSRPFSDFFDVTALAASYQRPVLEWQNVKSRRSPPYYESLPEKIGCWGMNGLSAKDFDFGLASSYNITADVWPVQKPLDRLSWSFFNPQHQLIEAQMQDSQPWVQTLVKRGLHDRVRPDHNLLCTSTLFFLRKPTFKSGRYRTPSLGQLDPDQPFWAQYGSKIRFSASLQHLADEVVATLLGSAQPFIAVHIRRADFVHLQWVANGTIASSLDLYAPAIDRIRRQSPALSRLPVLVATDERSSDYQAAIRKRGWVLIDHRRLATAERLSNWYPPLLDMAILAMGRAFVGTEGSTMSSLAGARVRDWYSEARPVTFVKA